MIIRGPKPQSNFLILDKRISEDERLSFASRGMLVLLLGKPDHWTVSIPALIANTSKCVGRKMGRDAIYGLIDELIQVGYMTRRQARRPDGTLGPIDYVVCELPEPLPEKPEAVNQPLPENPEAAPLPALPYTGEPYTANPTVVSIDSKQGLKTLNPGDGTRVRARVRDEPVGFDPASAVFTGISDALRARWRAAYEPLVTVDAEILAAESWLLANPKEAGKKNFARYITGWLNRAKAQALDRAARGNGHPRAGPGAARPATAYEKRLAQRQAITDGLFRDLHDRGDSNAIDVTSTEATTARSDSDELGPHPA